MRIGLVIIDFQVIVYLFLTAVSPCHHAVALQLSPIYLPRPVSGPGISDQTLCWTVVGAIILEALAAEYGAQGACRAVTCAAV